ncbi:MAG TPA: DivIVA domain-containing protein [Acidimicrobiales bacterium]|nr:DivIVA domain-containing protein [Acidimicrobiales bacterium]
MAEQLHADQIASRDFPTTFRGFDQHEVRSFLGQVAAVLAASHERERALVARVAELEAAPPPALDEGALERALGQEATRVIHAAREAAAEIKERAETNAAAILAEANERNASARADAEAMAAVMRAEVDEALSVLRVDTERRATAIIDEAESKRERILDDLGRQRRKVLAQLEQLHAAREKLEGAYATVRAALDAATAEVTVADDDALAIARAAVAPAVPDPTPVLVEESVSAAPDSSTSTALDDEGDGEAMVDVDPVDAPEPEPVLEIVPDVEPEPEPAPVADDGRRSSSLRLLRPESDEEAYAPIADDAVEGVRILRPETEPEPVAVEPEPEPEPEPAPDPDPALAEASAAEEGAPSTRSEEPAPVEDLFARLRADRAEKTAAAVAVLTDPVEAEPAAEHEPEPIVADVEPSGDAALLATRDGAIADVERALVRTIKRALADEQNEVLDALRRLKGKPSVAAIMPDTAVHDARYEAVLSGAAATAASAGGAGDGRAVAADRGPAVAADLRARVGRVVDEAAGDVDTLIEAISATYREWKTSRTEALARDVVTAAYAGGLYEASAGDLRWVVDPAEGGCPDCDDNVLAGPTPKGTAFPTGQLHPPAHTGCRCVVVPTTS